MAKSTHGAILTHGEEQRALRSVMSGGWVRGSATERSMPDYKGTESREEVVADYTAVRDTKQAASNTLGWPTTRRFAAPHPHGPKPPRHTPRPTMARRLRVPEAGGMPGDCWSRGRGAQSRSSQGRGGVSKLRGIPYTGDCCDPTHGAGPRAGGLSWGVGAGTKVARLAELRRCWRRQGGPTPAGGPDTGHAGRARGLRA